MSISSSYSGRIITSLAVVAGRSLQSQTRSRIMYAAKHKANRATHPICSVSKSKCREIQELEQARPSSGYDRFAEASPTKPKAGDRPRSLHSAVAKKTTGKGAFYHRD